MIRRLENALIALGLLDASHEKWERTAGVWMFASLAFGGILLAAFIFDELLLDRRFNSVLRLIALVTLLSFFASVGYWGINARRHDPRTRGKLGWRALVFLLFLGGIACMHVFNYISAGN